MLVAGCGVRPDPALSVDVGCTLVADAAGAPVAAPVPVLGSVVLGVGWCAEAAAVPVVLLDAGWCAAVFGATVAVLDAPDAWGVTCPAIG
jgi:hypothetical protein